MRWTSPAGDLLLLANEQGLTQVFLNTMESDATTNAHIEQAIEQLTEYFAGKRKTFDLKLAPNGTPFQQDVWRELQKIPYGETRSYAQIANAIQRPSATRAVGAANGANPIPIIIPCHRVIGSNGKLTGFGGGIPMKRFLLDLECGIRPLTTGCVKCAY
jgi:methylated-DNA-[protein]-cysteine S-methyltransferase